MTDADIITATISYVKNELKDAEGGHDWFHIQRVYNNTLLIAKDEDVDLLVVCLGALLHDIADSKFHGGDESIGPKKTRDYLKSLGLKRQVIDHVVKIVRHISFKNTLSKAKNKFSSKELEVVRDADRLDAIGAIGIARAFHYGGYKNRVIYDPDIPPNPKLTKAAYVKAEGPSLNHFYEKLLLLKDMMHTKTGKKLAQERHDYMLGYLKQFYKEWGTAI